MIYCVVPEAFADELFDKLDDYYAEDPNVTVIVDRRRGPRRETKPGAGGGMRQRRDRRRPRIPGEIPQLTD